MSKAAAQTIAERKRARRPGPGVAKPKKATATIDLTKPDARKALVALYPRPELDTMLDATKNAERAAADYDRHREDEQRSKLAKEAAGNVLCNEIGKAKGIIGDGWKAVWDMRKGGVDWDGVVKELNIPAEVLERHRKPEYRQLDVRQIANDEA